MCLWFTVTDLQESWDDVRQQLQQRVLGDAFNDFGLHLDGGQVDGVIGRLHDGAEHLDALLRMDRAGQGGGRLLSCTNHLKAHEHKTHMHVKIYVILLFQPD